MPEVTVKEESPPSLFAKILAGLERFDKQLTGNAKGSVGINMSGSGTNSKESTASKASKNAVFLIPQTIDLTELLEMMDVMFFPSAAPVTCLPPRNNSRKKRSNNSSN